MGTLGGVLAAVARHFRHTPTALPLLAQPLGALGVGTFREGVLPPGLKVTKPTISASRKNVDLPPLEPLAEGEMVRPFPHRSPRASLLLKPLWAAPVRPLGG
jgi:hypothetical protein